MDIALLKNFYILWLKLYKEKVVIMTKLIYLLVQFKV